MVNEFLNIPDREPLNYGSSFEGRCFVDVCIDPGNSGPEDPYPPEHACIAECTNIKFAALFSKAPQMLQFLLDMYARFGIRSSGDAREICVRIHEFLGTLPEELQSLVPEE